MIAEEGDGKPAKNSDGTSTSAITAAAPDGAKLKDKDAGVAAGESKIANGDSVPSGGCMPIGLTAQGDMVFPLQCRELLEQRRGPVPSAVTAPEGSDQRNQLEAATPKAGPICGSNQNRTPRFLRK
jgi:hypothetical protein